MALFPGTFLDDFLLTHSIFFPDEKLCTAITNQYPFSILFFILNLYLILRGTGDMFSLNRKIIEYW